MNSLFFIPSGIYIGNLHIAFYAICIIVGAIVAYKLSQHFLKKKGFDPEAIENLFYIAFPCGIVGARIWYVIAQWSAEFASKPWYKVFFIWEGGLAIQGGVIAGVVAGVIFMIKRRPNIPVLLAADCIVPTILIAQAIGRWGNFFNQEVYGFCVDSKYWSWLPNFIQDRLTIQINNTGTAWETVGDSYKYLCEGGPNEMVLPLFLIEGIINVAGFFIITYGIPALFKFLSKKTHNVLHLANGDLAFSYLIWYGIVRAILEPMRNNSYIMGDYTSVIMSIVFVVVGVAGIVLCHIYEKYLKKKQPILSTNVIEGTEASKESLNVADLANAEKEQEETSENKESDLKENKGEDSNQNEKGDQND